MLQTRRHERRIIMCGIAGAVGVPNASLDVRFMLTALQHRGQEAAGIVSSDGSTFHVKRGFGLAGEVFQHTDVVQCLPGTMALGHLRYATSGGSRSPDAIQPFSFETFQHGQVALVHNGNLTNDHDLRMQLSRRGSIYRSESDTETFIHLLARSFGAEMVKGLAEVFSQVEGAFSLLIMTKDRFYAAVDPHSFRPLVIARRGLGYLFASESCAFDLFKTEITDVHTVQPGHLIEISAEGLRDIALSTPAYTRHCSFESIYFSRPDSRVFDRSVSAIRRRLGERLARTNVAPSDYVIAVPDSSNAMALAYARASGIPYEHGLIRNHYSGRTFTTPGQLEREIGVRMKLNPDEEVVRGHSLTVVDDSLVRGTTGKKVVSLLRDAGATEVHMRIASPPVMHPCYWGIDTPERAHLIAAQMSVDDVCAYIGADSLVYLSQEDLVEVFEDAARETFCTSCFTGNPPVAEHLIPPEYLVRRGCG